MELPTRTLDGSKSTRNTKYYLPFCFKIFGAEESSDSSKMGGFNDRTFSTKTMKGKPEFYVKKFGQPKINQKYRDTLL
jgi:hypothetical protein